MARRARARSSPEPSLEPDAASSANEAASSADETSSDEEQIEVEPNLATRSRRSNAGARMQALIEDEASAKIETDEMFKEEENDEEFEQKGAFLASLPGASAWADWVCLHEQRRRTSLTRTLGRRTRMRATTRTTKTRARSGCSARRKRPRRCVQSLSSCPLDALTGWPAGGADQEEEGFPGAGPPLRSADQSCPQKGCCRRCGRLHLCDDSRRRRRGRRRGAAEEEEEGRA